MNNPYFPKRKIRHADLLTKAGFKINKNWYRCPPDYSKPRGDCDKLIYWIKEDIRLVFFDYQRVSIKKLVERIEKQVERNTKEKVVVSFDSTIDQ